MMIEINKTDPDHSGKTGQYEANIASLFVNIVRMIPYGS
jgi:hypothetical protein